MSNVTPVSKDEYLHAVTNAIDASREGLMNISMDIHSHPELNYQGGYDRLPSIGVPTLICAGYYDGIAPPDNQKALESQIPDTTLEFFEGGHGFLSQDERAYKRIIEFLEG